MRLADPEAELTLLMEVLKNNNLVDDLFQKVFEIDITDSRAKQIFMFLKKCYKENKKPSQSKLWIHLKDKNIDPETVIQDTISVPSEFSDLVERVKGMSWKRKINQALIDIGRKIHEEDNMERLADDAQEIIFRATAQNKKQKNEYQLSEAMMEFYTEINDLAEGRKKTRGIYTGFPAFDYKFGGFRKGQLTVIAGRTSMGKTAFALNIAHNMIKRDDYKIYLVSLEMNAKEIAERVVAQNSLVPTSKYNASITQVDRDNLNLAISRLYEKEFWINQQRGLSVNQIKAIIRRKYRELEGLDLVIIDYLQMIQYDANQNLAKAVGDVVLELRNLAGELDIPIILGCQLSRGKERKHKARPDLSELRDSGNIEEIADSVVFVWRDKEEEGFATPAKIIVEKNRSGPGTGELEFVWYADYLYFRDQMLEDKDGPLPGRKEWGR